MNDKIRTLRAVLDEAARELKASPATQAKMAEMILRRAALGVSREELKEVAIEAGKIPAA
jgi:hypothetical protein